MSCIKTGARVYLPDYGLYAPADLYSLDGETIIVRFPKDPREYNSYVMEAPSGTTHVVRMNPPAYAEQMFDRGLAIVDKSMISPMEGV